MKLLPLFFALVSLTAASQSTASYIGFRYGHLEMDNFDGRNYGGLELEINYESNFGIQYSLLTGKNYFHMPMAPVAGLALGLVIANSTPLNDSNNNSVGLGIVLGLITALIPESFSYNVPLNNTFTVTPYISPLQMDFLKNEGDIQGNWYAGLGVGTRLHIYSKTQKFRLSPYIEYKVHYNEQIPRGYTYGINLATRISKPKE